MWKRNTKSYWIKHNCSSTYWENSVVFLWEENFLASHISDLIRSPAKLQPRHRSIDQSIHWPLISPRKEGLKHCFFYRSWAAYVFRKMSFNSFQCISIRHLKEDINIAMHYGIALKNLGGERHTSDSFKNIMSKITSSFPNFDHRTLWQMSHNSRREEVMIGSVWL